MEIIIIARFFGKDPQRTRLMLWELSTTKPEELQITNNQIFFFMWYIAVTFIIIIIFECQDSSEVVLPLNYSPLNVSKPV